MTVPGLIDAQHRLAGQGRQHLLIRRLQRVGRFGDGLGQQALAQLNPHHLGEEVLDAAVRQVAGPLEVGHQGDQARREQLTATNTVRRGRNNDAAGIEAAVTPGPVFDDLKRSAVPFDLLHDPPDVFIGIVLGDRSQSCLVFKRVRPALIDLFGLE